MLPNHVHLVAKPNGYYMSGTQSVGRKKTNQMDRHLPLQRNVGSPAYCVLYPGDLSPGNKYGQRSSTVWQIFRHGRIRFRRFSSVVFRFDLVSRMKHVKRKINKKKQIQNKMKRIVNEHIIPF